MRYLKIVVLSVILAVLNTGCSSDVPSDIQDVGAKYLDHLYLVFTDEEEYDFEYMHDFQVEVYEYMEDAEQAENDDLFWEIFSFMGELDNSSEQLLRNNNPDYLFQFMEDYNHMAELLDLDNQYYIED